MDLPGNESDRIVLQREFRFEGEKAQEQFHFEFFKKMVRLISNQWDY